jgi:hypothetical protein
MGVYSPTCQTRPYGAPRVPEGFDLARPHRDGQGNMVCCLDSQSVSKIRVNFG